MVLKKENIDLDAKIEAALFLLGEPVKIEFLAKTLGEEINKVSEAICILDKNLENRGICLIQKDGKVMLSTSGAASDITQKIMKEKYEEELTKPMLETLAIILYKCPPDAGVSKAEIDCVRGVNSVFTLRNLLIRGLIERRAFTPLETSPQKNSSKRVSDEDDEKKFLMGSKKTKGFFYQPSFQLLQFLGVKNLKELPWAQHFRQRINEFMNEQKI